MAATKESVFVLRVQHGAKAGHNIRTRVLQVEGIHKCIRPRILIYPSRGVHKSF